MIGADATRQELIDLCEKSIVDQEKWCNRDSQGAQFQIGELWALLRSGCEFTIVMEDDICATDERTVWVEVRSKGFGYFEGGEMKTEQFYLPQPERISDEDWY